MRILLGGLTHEANTFCPHAADMNDFDSRQMLRGQDLLAHWQRTRTEQAGAMSVFSQRPDCDIIPTFLARGISAGPIQAETYTALRDELLASLEARLPADGVFLVLHGAMMAETEPDATGDVLASVRALVGRDVPVVGTLDLHANVTRRMVDEATALIGYHTAPHVDMYETGRKAAQTLLDILDGDLTPANALVRIPMIVPPENSTHEWGPLAEVINAAKALEEAGEIVHASIYPVQPWMDTPDMAASVLMVTNNDTAAAQRQALALAERFWSLRHQFDINLTPPDEAVRQALARSSGTVILCDSADATSSGSTGDSTVVLSALLQAAPLDVVALCTVVDPEAVQQAIEAGVGATLRITVGGKRAPEYFRPVTLDAYVKTISDGAFTFKGPGMRGVPHQMGRTVVIYAGNIHLVVMEHAVSQWDPQLYRSVGEEPSDARMVQVKSPMAFRAGYEDIFDEVIIVAAPGAANPDIANLPWKRLPRPIYPLDADLTWP